MHNLVIIHRYLFEYHLKISIQKAKKFSFFLSISLSFKPSSIQKQFKGKQKMSSLAKATGTIAALAINNKHILQNIKSMVEIADHCEHGNLPADVEEATVSTLFQIKGIGIDTTITFACDDKKISGHISMLPPDVKSLESKENGGVEFPLFWNYVVADKQGLEDEMINECIKADVSEMFTRVTPKDVKVTISNEPQEDKDHNRRRLWGFLKNIVNIDRFFDSGVKA